ncbi:glycosyltransferase [Deminuibacter soli]|uniref:Glycosyltransferase n=1 Tax=Deminuibacter soli TaxID=2291815 RepID=A0A3E1NRN5_9BACT|nr:glycosyltransferase [Deminuibacter soli]RFM30504.1 glycosyltransferase [Deminuibacter soli]
MSTIQTPAKQIFQTATPTRWQRFKWVGRILLFLLLLAGVVVYFAIRNVYTPSLPKLGAAMKSALQDDKPIFATSPLSKKYKGFRSAINAKWAAGKGQGQKNKTLNLSNSSLFSDSLGIRAAFYVDWDLQSLISLRKNVSKLNLVIPEWLFIDPKADTVYTNIDTRALDVIQKAGVKIMPMLSNYAKGKWQGEAVHRILHDPAKKERLIQSLLHIFKQYDFAGLNVDFEDLKEDQNEYLTTFLKELYERLHSNGYLVTQNVAAFNEDYDYEALSNYNDYLFLMAYDEHSDDTGPGPISSQKWIEAAVDQVAKKVPSKKIVLNIAGYGYDWSKDTVQTVSFQEALTLARDNDATIDFDNNTYNAKFSYTDDNNVAHQVHFADAATNFNTIRFATEYGLAGTAMWRLGNEDSRLWDFYDLPMTKAALTSFNYEDFSSILGTNDVDYIGEGEVLDVQSTPANGHISIQLDSTEYLIAEEHYDSLPSNYVVKKWGAPKDKKMVLTFDDGPDPVYTKQILDTLAKYKVPAAFFIVGIQAENYIPLVKRIYNEGYEIGNHTFTHPNIANISKKRALLEMDATRLLIECIIGRSTILFRAPFNADSEPEKAEEIIPVALSRSRNYLTIGESIDPEDWQASIDPTYNADTIFNRIVREQNRGNIILLHDAGGPREATIKALPRIIKYFQSQGYRFTTIADLLGKSKEELMPPIPKDSGYGFIQMNMILAQGGYYLGHILEILFLSFLTISMIRLAIIGVLAVLQKRKEKKLAHLSGLPGNPLVSIIVPAFNEEVNAVSSMQNLLACDYPNFEIIFVNDGSSDRTYEVVYEAFKDHPLVRVFTKPNGGKASALNYGIAQSSADYVVCIDADTKLRPDAVRMLVRSFVNEKIGAVAGTVKVGNERNLLTRWQSIEYITSQNFDRKAFAYVNAITVVPGAIGAFRKEAIEAAGGFTTDTLAEDCDITIRILRCGYIVANESKALAFTEAPETLKQFFKQRFRWSFGVMQTFWKNNDAVFNHKYTSLGWLALPDILLFKYIIPLFTPLADIIMILGLMTDNRGKIFTYYLVFMIVDAAIALLAFGLEKEKPAKLVWMIPQRLVYRWLMIVVLFRSFKRAIKGELQHWGVLKRTGNVKEIPAHVS